MNINSSVLYKSNVAVVTGKDIDKFVIKYCSAPATATKRAVYSEQKVRAKDVVLLHQGPVSSLEKLLSYSNPDVESQLEEAYELLTCDESTASEPISIGELSELAFGGFDADSSWFIYSTLIDKPFFALSAEEFKNGNIVFIPRSRADIEKIKQQELERKNKQEAYGSFIQRLKKGELLPEDSSFMGEVEALALGKTGKSKIMQEIGIPQTEEKAHQLLLDTGIWDCTRNPYPPRFGFSFESAKDPLGPMPEEERMEVPGFAYAIDGEHSTDPDDAVGFDGEYYWVHIADPASSVKPDSAVDIAARNRGTTLYIPEGASRMLCESHVEDYALGLKQHSNALSFRLKLDEDAQIEECKVFITSINVKRMTYRQAEEQKESAELKPFFEIARKNLAKRERNGSINIAMPRVHVYVDKETKVVGIEDDEQFESNRMIQEMMLLAGEGAARFAFENKIPFPYYSQEAPEFPESIPDGLAGEFAKLRCMSQRSIGLIPAHHTGLGLTFYSQVTSPLRRYGDLVAHQQLRAFLKGEPLMDKDEMFLKITAGNSASSAAKKASTLSETHWKLVYLLQNPELSYEAYCIDIKRKGYLFLIPALGMQTLLMDRKNYNLNDCVTLRMKSVNIPLLEAIFS